MHISDFLVTWMFVRFTGIILGRGFLVFIFYSSCALILFFGGQAFLGALPLRERLWKRYRIGPDFTLLLVRVTVAIVIPSPTFIGRGASLYSYPDILPTVSWFSNSYHSASIWISTPVDCAALWPSLIDVATIGMVSLVGQTSFLLRWKGLSHTNKAGSAKAISPFMLHAIPGTM